MRGVIMLVKVVDHSSLARDISSNAIINMSESDYDSYRRKKEIMKKQKLEIESQVKEIESIKCEINEIKSMLLCLLSKDK